VRAVKFLLPILICAGLCFAQQNQNNDSTDNTDNSGKSPVQRIARTTKAVDYRQGSKSEIDLVGTDRMPQASGKAHIDAKSGTAQVKVELQNLTPANSFGLEYLTYVLWAISPEGVPSNLGEFIVKDGKSSLHATVPLQAFALIVTAEPYFAVTQPSEKVVLQNQPGPKAEGWTRSIDLTYQVVPATIYASQVQPIEEPVYGMAKNLPLSLEEARNAVRIAKAAQAEQYAPDAMDRARKLLSQADDYYNSKQNDKAITTVAREAVQAAEAARVKSIQAAEQARVNAETQAAQVQAANAQADAELQSRQAQQADAARQAAEQQAAQAQAAAQQAATKAQEAQQQLQQQINSGQQVQAEQQAAAAQAEAQAQQASQAAAAAQQRAQEEASAAQAAQQQLQQEQAARQQAEQQAQNTQQQLQQAQDSQQQLQQQVQQAQTEKEQMRQRLLGQLNQVLETKDSARGLIVNMPDVLFNVNSANLKPEARERLAKVAGILIAYPDIRVEVDGYTDNTGSLGYNQQLSEQRADAVREFLVQQGVPSSSVGAKGFGPNDPVASNDSPEGRQQNRRVNLIVSGESIGAQLIPPGAPSQ
jgi:outer membrane protein OmpA-like peptidoglycan-associated protein